MYFCMFAFTCTRKLVLVVCLCVIVSQGTGVCAMRNVKIWFRSARSLISNIEYYSTNDAGTATTTISAEIGNVFRVYLRACVIAFALN